MKPMKIATMLAAFALLAAPAWADWDPGDPFKMHYPQLPDPIGWDVHFTTAPHVLADDFLCTSSGPITDIHFWYSWSQDLIGEIDKIHASIHSDIPADPTGGGPLYSRPGQELWSKDFVVAQDRVLLRPYGSGEQGFYAPEEGWNRPDHVEFWQANLYIDPAEAFIQEEGTIYWLDLYVELPAGTASLAGWKTSIDHWNDDAVYWFDDGAVQEWRELRDPINGESLDLAFVITTIPEPGSITLLGLVLLSGLAVFLRR